MIDGERCPSHPQWYRSSSSSESGKMVCPWCAQESRAIAYAKQRATVHLLHVTGGVAAISDTA